MKLVAVRGRRSKIIHACKSKNYGPGVEPVKCWCYVSLVDYYVIGEGVSPDYISCDACVNRFRKRSAARLTRELL